ncbi:unnamed protein product, partial [Phaeothamnion confervicola]
ADGCGASSSELAWTTNEASTRSGGSKKRPRFLGEGDAGVGMGPNTAAQDRPSVAVLGASATIQVNRRQKGNPVLALVKNVRWEFADRIMPDYILGSTSCALFVSVRFHLLHRKYIHMRIAELRNDFRLRVLLCLVDNEDNVEALRELNTLALLNNMSLVLAWTAAEAARYLETFKAYANKSAASIQERIDTDYLAHLHDALSCVRSVNRTDVATLASSFGSLAAICGASMEALAMCPGIGEKKVVRLYEALHQPFLPNGTSNGGSSSAAGSGDSVGRTDSTGSGVGRVKSAGGGGGGGGSIERTGSTGTGVGRMASTDSGSGRGGAAAKMAVPLPGTLTVRVAAA